MKATVSAFDVEELHYRLHGATLTLLAIHTAMVEGSDEPRSWSDALFFLWDNFLDIEKKLKALYEGDDQCQR